MKAYLDLLRDFIHRSPLPSSFRIRHSGCWALKGLREALLKRIGVRR